MINTCIVCKNDFKATRRKTKSCSRVCLGKYISSLDRGLKGKPKPKGFGEKISKSLTGKPKPWNRGKNNPNYGNKAQNKYKEKFLKAVKERGQPWTEKDRKLHSTRMKGSTNWMTGKRHSSETKKLLSQKAKERYKNKTTYYRINISKAEKIIHSFLQKEKISVIIQYSIPGIAFIYDFYIPEFNLIIEYNGDYWHFNPDKYKSTDSRTERDGSITTAADIWKRDKIKRKLAIANNYHYLVVWEGQHKRSNEKLEQIISKIIKEGRTSNEKTINFS